MEPVKLSWLDTYLLRQALGVKRAEAVAALVTNPQFPALLAAATALFKGDLPGFFDNLPPALVEKLKSEAAKWVAGRA